jgi:hypothetical protein
MDLFNSSLFLILQVSHLLDRPIDLSQYFPFENP